MLDLLWETPLGLGSLAFYRLNRSLLRSLYQRHLLKHPERAQSWRPVSSAMLSERGALPCMMTTGPRWNPHAVIAAAGPLTVDSHLALDTARADASAGEWTVVCHTFPGHQLAGSLGRGHPTGRLDLPPGQYILFSRYYHCQSAPGLPAIAVDGRPVVAAREISPGNNAFYEELAGRASWYYRALHWYVFPALKYRNRLPEAWVAREFLPAGNPETRFTFGHVVRGEELEMLCDEECLRSFHVYLTLYNRASFPTLWREINAPRTSVRPPATGFYLTRRHLRAGRADGAGAVELRRAERPGAGPSSAL